MTQEQDGPMMLTIAVLGGTGKEGSGLAMRWAQHGYRVIIGSRVAERAENRAAELNAKLGAEYITGLENGDAAKEADLVVLTVPYSAHKRTIEAVKAHLSGKILVDVTVPLQPPNVRTVHVPEGKAAALEAKDYLGNTVKIISAFQNVSASKLKDSNTEIDCDVLICGDDPDAKAETMKLVEAAGMRPIDAGPLENSVAAETLTPVLLYINRTYNVVGAGIRITGLE